MSNEQNFQEITTELVNKILRSQDWYLEVSTSFLEGLGDNLFYRPELSERFSGCVYGTLNEYAAVNKEIQDFVDKTSKYFKERGNDQVGVKENEFRTEGLMYRRLVMDSSLEKVTSILSKLFTKYKQNREEVKETIRQLRTVWSDENFETFARTITSNFTDISRLNRSVAVMQLKIENANQEQEK